MPRGVKGSGTPRRVTLEKQLTKSLEKIEKLEEQLSIARAEYQELLDVKKLADLEKIEQAAEKMGLSIEDLLDKVEEISDANLE